MNVFCIHMRVPVHKCVCERACVGGDQSGQLCAPSSPGPPVPQRRGRFPISGGPEGTVLSRGGRRRSWWGVPRTRDLVLSRLGAAWLWTPLRAPGSGDRSGLRAHLQWLDLPKRRGPGRPGATDLGLCLGAPCGRQSGPGKGGAGHLS